MKILVRLPNWLGDLVMSTGFLHHLRNVYPMARVDVIVKKGIHSLVDYFEGITEVFVFDKADYPGLRGAGEFGKMIGRTNTYDLAFCLPDSFSSALMLYKTGAKKRVGYRKELRSFMLTHAMGKPSNVHRVREYLYLLEHFSRKQCQDPVVRLLNRFTPENGRIIVNVNSEAESRRLPVEKATRVLNNLLTHTNSQLVMVGAPKEVPHVTAVYDGLVSKSNVINMAGQTDMHGLIELFSTSRVMLTTDSGPMHLANALGVHTVALEGASDERNTAPFNSNNSTLIRYGGLPCEPCVKNTCKFGLPKCLMLMDEERIAKAVASAEALLEN